MILSHVLFDSPRKRSEAGIRFSSYGSSSIHLCELPTCKDRIRLVLNLLLLLRKNPRDHVIDFLT